MPRVLIRDIVDLQEEVGYIFDQLAPDLSGKRVLIKPNMMMPLPGDSGKVTHPELVRACRLGGADGIARPSASVTNTLSGWRE